MNERQKTLSEIARDVGTDKVLFGYTDVYHGLFNPLRDMSGGLVEIGVKDGASMRMWSRYLPAWDIDGVDCNSACGLGDLEGADFILGDQSTRQGVAEINDFIDAPDIIIDDGSHLQHDIMITFEALFPRLLPGGYYVIEDVANRQISLEMGHLWGCKSPTFADSVISWAEQFPACSTHWTADGYRKLVKEQYHESDIRIYYAQQPPLTKRATSDLVIIRKGMPFCD